MKLRRLKLTGNKRLLLAKIEYIQIDFESDCQTIIGTNGSGKSTLLREANPLPPISNDYNKGGGKEVVFEDAKGEVYTANSVLEKSWTHSLIRHSDNMELNPGSTKRVQEQLVQDITGLNYDLLDILVGDTLFTQMAPAKRREWILQFSGSDLEYAMKVYKNLNRRYMDAQALQKHYAKRLATEIEGVMSEEELLEMKKYSDLLIKQINALMLERDPNTEHNSQHYRNALDQALSGMQHYESRINDFKLKISSRLGQLIHSEQDIPVVKHGINADITRFERELNQYYAEQAKLRDYLDLLKANGMQGLDELLQSVEAGRKQLEELQHSLEHHLEWNNPQAAHGALSSMIMDLVSIFNHIPADIAEYEKLINTKAMQMNKTRELMENRQHELNQLEHQLYHINNLQAMDCPKCDHHWTPGVDEADRSQLNMRYDRTRDALEQLKAAYQEFEDFSVQADEHHRRMRQLNEYAARSPMLGPMWHHIFEHINTNQPAILMMSYVHEYLADLETSVKIVRLSEEVHMNEAIINNARAISGDGDINRDRLQVLDENIQHHIRQIKDCRDLLQDLTHFEREMKKLDADSGHYQKYCSDVELVLYQYIISTRNECLNEDIMQLQTSVAEIQGKVGNASTARALIAELRKNKQQADDDVQIYKSLVDGLSPTDGLIAERIRVFIDGFIEQMNAVIEEVWTYPMKIVSCGVDEAIDCKFPLEAEGEHSDGVIKVTSPDIAKSSSAQTDIINFAFRLVAMICLGLEHYPLYLDEAGVRMDEKHRDKFNGLVDRILEHRRVSQVFMISHYAAMHGVFTNAQIAVLDKTNIITLPDEYNRHVDIAYSS